MVEPINTENTDNLNEYINPTNGNGTQQAINQPLPTTATYSKEQGKNWWHHLGLHTDTPKSFVQPWCGGKPLWYCEYRIAGWIYAGASIIVLIFTNTHGAKYFIYMTHWIYLVMCTSIIINAYTFVRYYFFDDDIQLTWHIKLNWVLTNIWKTMSIIFGVVYWFFLIPEAKVMDFNRVNANALCALYAILDDIIGAAPVYMAHVYQPCAFGVIYLVFTIIYFANGGTDEYNQPQIFTILDYSKPRRAVMWSSILTFFALPSIHFSRFMLNWLARGGKLTTVVQKSMQSSTTAEI